MNLKKPEDLYKKENLELCVLATQVLERHESWHITNATPTSFTLECDTLRITFATTLTE